MSRTIARLAAVPVALAAAVAAIVISTGSTTSTSREAMIPAVCHDGFVLWNYYNDIGDSYGASALLSNLYGMGCFD